MIRLMDHSPETHAGRLVVVCGLPGSGKTTLACRLEDEHGAFRFCPDEWMHDFGIDLFDATARERIEQLQWRIAQRLLDLGGTVIIEWGTWTRAERDALRHGARALGAAVELHFLDAPVAVLWARVQKRDMELFAGRRTLTREDIDGYDTMFERPDAEELSLYDPPSS
jgi:predicted kinase